MKYICEVCNKRYDNQEDAMKCEAEHKAEAEKKKVEEETKKARSKTIEDAVNAYIAKYGELPDVNITKENRLAISKYLGFRGLDTWKELFDLIAF